MLHESGHYAIFKNTCIYANHIYLFPQDTIG